MVSASVCGVQCMCELRWKGEAVARRAVVWLAFRVSKREVLQRVQVPDFGALMCGKRNSAARNAPLSAT